MIDAGMIEEALCDFFRSKEKGFQIVEESAMIPGITRPSMSWHVSGGTFEADSKGILTEKLNVVCFVATENVASEKRRRAEACRISHKVISRLSGISLPLKDSSRTGIFEPVSWLDVSTEAELEQKLMVARIEFSVSMPAQSEAKRIEESSESLKESIRTAVKALLETPAFGYRTLPTLGDWEFQNENETLAKVFWSGESEAIDRRAHSFLRRQDALSIVVAAPCTPDNWQDITSLTEENFCYSKISQTEIRKLMPETRAQMLGDVSIGGASVECPALPEAYAVSRISIMVQYSIIQRG